MSVSSTVSIIASDIKMLFQSKNIDIDFILISLTKACCEKPLAKTLLLSEYPQHVAMEKIVMCMYLLSL